MHSPWICHTCREEFQTKGRRDAHRERVHRQKTLSKQGPVRSENGKFVCGCGRDYVIAQSLKRHQKNCHEATVMDETSNDDEDNDEGIRAELYV